ncbi:MAG: PIN domain-containing protein [Betaproteobacteria bacterium]|nr:PIN domain-containing protein [Betaproteobacteria bacterium]
MVVLTAREPRAHYGVLASELPTTRRLLLDVNVWVALFDDAHIASPQANALIDTPGIKIATSPLVENGVIRVLNLPSYGRRGALGLQRVRAQLMHACASLDHQFWADDVTLRDDAAVDFNRVHGHNQITDLYLLALAVKHEGTLVTFDQGIPLAAVRNATPQHLFML